MFAVGLMAVCSLNINILYDDMPLVEHVGSAYGTIIAVVDDDKEMVINFEEFLNKSNNPHTKVVGDYSTVKVKFKDCIPF